MLGGKMLLMKVRFILERDEENAWKSERQFLRVFFSFRLPIFTVKISFAKTKQCHINKNVDRCHQLPETEKYLKLKLKPSREKGKFTARLTADEFI